MLVPRTRGEVKRPLLLDRALARDDVDDAARRVRSIDGCARALDDLDLIHALDAEHLVEVDARGLAARGAVAVEARAREVVHTSPIDENNDT